MSSMDIQSKHHWDGPKGSCPTYDVRFTIPEEHECRQRTGRDITKNDILDLKIDLSFAITVEQILEVL
jgi:hypothetical protein